MADEGSWQYVRDFYQRLAELETAQPIFRDHARRMRPLIDVIMPDDELNRFVVHVRVLDLQVVVGSTGDVDVISLGSDEDGMYLVSGDDFVTSERATLENFKAVFERVRASI